MKLEFIPNDLWIGIYWKKKFEGFEYFSVDSGEFNQLEKVEVRKTKIKVHICLIPTLCFSFDFTYTKQSDPQPSVGLLKLRETLTHPNCRCSLKELPKGVEYFFNDKRPNIPIINLEQITPITREEVRRTAERLLREAKGQRIYNFTYDEKTDSNN